jgi:MinD-like ATPase involved in chromosome partitioning or flagellar assembly
MSDNRWVLLGLAPPRTQWFREVAGWATAGSISADFEKYVSSDEVRSRLASGQPFSALLVDRSTIGLDRDLIDDVRAAGGVAIVVGSADGPDWTELGAAAVLADDFEPPRLNRTLRDHATPITRVTASPPDPSADGDEESSVGQFVAVTGAGGTGTSVVAMGLAQWFSDSAAASDVLLADLRLDAELAMLHDARMLAPGLQELVEAHRGGRLSSAQVRSLTFHAAAHGYQLLLGLRRHRDWTVLRPRAFAAALDGLLAAHRIVIADVDADIEGEASTGSRDVEDRNLIARHALPRADLVVIVGNPTPKGVHSLVRTVRDLRDGGIDASRMLAVLNRSPRGLRTRADAVSAFAALVDGEPGLEALGNPVLAPQRHDLDSAIRDGVRVPPPLTRGVHREVRRRLDELLPRSPDLCSGDAPVPVAVGSLGHWSGAAR